MSRAQHRNWRRVARLGRLVVRLAVVVVAVRLGVVVVGTIVTSAVVAVTAIVAAVRWWARVVEPRLFGPTRPPATPAARVAKSEPATDDLHLVFARALALVAARYLAECETQARKDRP